MSTRGKIKDAAEILTLLAVLLAIPMFANRLTPALPTKRIASESVVYAHPSGSCLECQTGSNAAWFAAYDECRRNDPNGDPQQCTAAGDRASACYIIHHWSGQCERCGGVIPDQNECGE